MSRNRLRPHAEGAKRRASARGVKRHVGVQQERHVVAFDFQVALVNVRGERQRVQPFRVQLRTFGVVHDLSVFAVADTENLDRKSTRLNSSHGYISYAVFCLKKKKTQHVLSITAQNASCAS